MPPKARTPCRCFPEKNGYFAKSKMNIPALTLPFSSLFSDSFSITLLYSKKFSKKIPKKISKKLNYLGFLGHSLDTFN